MRVGSSIIHVPFARQSIRNLLSGEIFLADRFHTHYVGGKFNSPRKRSASA